MVHGITGIYQRKTQVRQKIGLQEADGIAERLA